MPISDLTLGIYFLYLVGLTFHYAPESRWKESGYNVFTGNRLPLFIFPRLPRCSGLKGWLYQYISPV